jgi:mono/diheme cytochrome c family protein
MDVDLRRLTEEKFHERGGKEPALPGTAMVAGRGRVDMRFATDHDGELYVFTKSDGMIRKVVAAKVSDAPALSTSAAPATNAAPTESREQNATTKPAAGLVNPVASTPASIAAGKRVYDTFCTACHGNLAQGAVKAGMTISIIEEQKGKQPPDLTDDHWDNGSTDGHIFTAIKRGLPPTMMPGFNGQIPDDDIWSVVNYIRTLQAKQ